ncbi:DNA adenine methylase [Amphibacillus indicireducens]|uniref:DNA adenine methylase n=1 Tax=Amphibacillus indicireducens TaxID=1076330 RepID=A0ABP7V0K9_9BACI
MTKVNISKSFKKLNINEHIPHIIKYMGSKKSIINYVVEGINDCYTGGKVVDLFAGSSVLSGALRGQTSILSNDIQQYSAILAETYLNSYNWDKYDNILEKIVTQSKSIVAEVKMKLPELTFDYNKEFKLKEFNELEKKQQDLINYNFSNIKYHLFMKNYSGTYWSFNQCLWIDSIRGVAEEYKNTNIYYPIMSSLMFAMSYNSQSTGHYAQYRDATNERNMNDILIYRRKDILSYFIRKFTEFMTYLKNHDITSQTVSLDYNDCLSVMPKNSTVYADPPYAFVHYSRFYHALETLVRYDYPKVMYKGRYRTDRHQSPFCIKSKVRDAFVSMFDGVSRKESNLVLSYSNTGMIALEELIELANTKFSKGYNIEVRVQDYQHSTMGRKEDKSRNVQEALILIKME